MSIRKEIKAAVGIIIPLALAACNLGSARPAANATEIPLPAPTGTQVPLDIKPTVTAILPPPVVEQATRTPFPPTPTPEVSAFDPEHAFAILYAVSFDSGLDITKEGFATSVVYPRVEEKMVDKDPHNMVIQPSETVLVPFTTFPYLDESRPIGTIGVFMDNSTSPVPPSTSHCDILIYDLGMIAVDPENTRYRIYRNSEINWGSIPKGAMVSEPNEVDRGRYIFGYMQLFNPSSVPCTFTFSVHPLNFDNSQQATQNFNRS